MRTSRHILSRSPARPRLLAALCLALPLLASCAPAEPRVPPGRDEALSLVAEGGEALARGDGARAEELLHRALALDAGLVEAHRAWQNLLESEYRGHEAVETYRRLAEKNPDDAGFLYLAGRVAADPDEQARFFRRAVARDPDGYWSSLGMGFALFQDGSFRRARIYFDRAVRARPGSAQARRLLAEAWIGQNEFGRALEALREGALLDPADRTMPLRAAQILLVTGRRSEAFALLLGLISGEETPDPTARSLLLRLLRDETGPGRFRETWAVERENLARFPGDPDVEAFAGTLNLELGRPAEAAKLLAAAAGRGGSPARVLLDLRRALFSSGRYAEGFALWKGKAPAEAFDEARNEAAPHFAAVERAVRGAAEGSPAALETLGERLLRCGWVEEAVAVLGKVGGDGRAADLLREGQNHLAFVRELRRYIGGEYRRFIEEEDGRDLASLLEGLGTLSMKCVGRDLGAGNPVRSLFLVGDLVESTAESPAPLVTYFEGFNKLLILGRRAGGTPEAVLMTVVVRDRSRSFRVLGDDLSCDFTAGEDFALESLGEYMGGAILGVGLLGRFYANLDEAHDRDVETWRAWRRAMDQRTALAVFRPWRARDPRDALALDTGHGLAENLLLAAFGDLDADAAAGAAGPPAARAALAGVLDHELQHVRDARRYLPVSRHLGAALALGIRHGFSKNSIEAEMEERAALAALASSARPHLELFHLVQFAPYPESQLPHSRGYCRLLRRILARAAATVPTLDRERNLCRQLHRIPAERVHEIATALAREEGLFR